jgi:hypothetical protein
MTATLYRKFNWPKYEQIQEKLVPYILEQVDQMPERFLFNKFTREQKEQIFQLVPELKETIDEIIGDEILDIKAIYIDKTFRTKNVAHIDAEEKTSDTYCRLNWPILNSDNHETVYFDTELDPVWEEVPGGTGAFTYNEDTLERIGSFILDAPTLMNVLEIHGMYPLGNRFPRIILTIDFDNSNSAELKKIIDDAD